MRPLSYWEFQSRLFFFITIISSISSAILITDNLCKRLKTNTFSLLISHFCYRPCVPCCPWSYCLDVIVIIYLKVCTIDKFFILHQTLVRIVFPVAPLSSFKPSFLIVFPVDPWPSCCNNLF